MTTGTEHTSGPWTIGDVCKKESELMVYCDDSLGSRVADCSTSGHGISVEQDIANARLIAAAPELLEGMKDLYRAYVSLLEAGRDQIATYGDQCDSVEVMERGDPWLKKARNAIAKAEGKS